MSFNNESCIEKTSEMKNGQHKPKVQLLTKNQTGVQIVSCDRHWPDWTSSYKTLKSIEEINWFFNRMCGLEKESAFYCGPAVFLVGNEKNNPSDEIMARLSRKVKKGGPTTLVLGGCLWLNWEGDKKFSEFEARKEEYTKWRDLSLAFLKERFGEHLINVTVQLNMEPHMHFMVLTTGIEGQPMVSDICAKGLYFSMLNREYIEYVDEKLGLPNRFPMPFIQSDRARKSKRTAIAQYCKVKNWFKQNPGKQINWLEFDGIWVWDQPLPLGSDLSIINGQRVTIGQLWNNRIKDLNSLKGRYLYLKLLWEICVFRAIKTYFIVLLENNRVEIQDKIRRSKMNKYLKYPEVYGKTHMFLGGKDLDLGAVLTRLFKAKPISSSLVDERLKIELESNCRIKLGLLLPDKQHPIISRRDVRLNGLYYAQEYHGDQRLRNKAFIDKMNKKYKIKGGISINKEVKETENLDIKTFILYDGRYVSVNNAKWYDHKKDKAGLGSKTLIDSILGLNPEDAMAEMILAENIDVTAAKQSSDFYRCNVLAEQMYEARHTWNPLPPPDEELWPKAKLKLIERGVKEYIVDYYHERGLVYGNIHGNLVFVCQDKGMFMLFSGSGGIERDAWLWPSEVSGPFVLEGLEKDIWSNVKSPLDKTEEHLVEAKNPEELILTDNPLTALKVKAVNIGQKVLAISPRILPSVLIPQIKDRPIILAAKDGSSFEMLSKTIDDLKSN
jgi:hypothetical protein